MERGQVMKDKKDLVGQNWVKRDIGFGSKGSSRRTNESLNERILRIILWTANVIMAEFNMKILALFHPCFITCLANQITVLGQKHSIRPNYFRMIRRTKMYRFVESAKSCNRNASNAC